MFSFALMFANGWFTSCVGFYDASACWLTGRNHGSKLASFLSPRISPEQVDQCPPLLDTQLTATFLIPRQSSNITFFDKPFWPNPTGFVKNFLRPKLAFRLSELYFIPGAKGF